MWYTTINHSRLLERGLQQQRKQHFIHETSHNSLYYKSIKVNLTSFASTPPCGEYQVLKTASAQHLTLEYLNIQIECLINSSTLGILCTEYSIHCLWVNEHLNFNWVMLIVCNVSECKVALEPYDMHCRAHFWMWL